MLGADRNTKHDHEGTSPQSGKYSSGSNTSSSTGAEDAGTGSDGASRETTGPDAKAR